ncbi:hypothetical protein [Paenibacillus sp. Marseille-Q4541]|uniref:hypothetical protein n=1 Tax=Paenibacillus sp. Marseille-Q4541 TaxID=2831522 RepID=UPI001BA49814|nr:hypothetical protein [Paenibacillus sp. Marseille-Q4541]
MPTFTTGLITNTRATGTAASNVIVSVRNLGSATASIVVVVFVVPMSNQALTPMYVSGYSVTANSSDIRQFSVAGDIAYEVQYSITATNTQVAVSTFGLDEFGNLVTEQGILHSELIPTIGLSIQL